MLVVLIATGFDPAGCLLATVGLVHRIWTGQGTIDGRDVVVKEAGTVEVDALVNNGLVVRVQGMAIAVERAGAFEVTGFDLECVEAPVVVGIKPFADRIAVEGWLFVFRPGASIGVDAPPAAVVEPYIGGLRRNDELDALLRRHGAWHAARNAAIGQVVALSAVSLVLEAGFVDGLIFRRQRNVLAATGRLARVITVGAALGAPPLTAPVRIFVWVLRLRADQSHQHC